MRKVETLVKYLNNILKDMVMKMVLKSLDNISRVMLNLCQAGRERPPRRSC